MAKLIIKNRYIKGGGHAKANLKYIGTRDGVQTPADTYLEYMSERPRSHGLFGDEERVDMDAALEGRPRRLLDELIFASAAIQLVAPVQPEGCEEGEPDGHFVVLFHVCHTNLQKRCLMPPQAVVTVSAAL